MNDTRIVTAAELGRPACDWELTLHHGAGTGYRCVLPADEHVGHIVRRATPATGTIRLPAGARP